MTTSRTSQTLTFAIFALWAIWVASCGAKAPTEGAAPTLYTIEDGEALLAQERYEQAAEVFEALLQDNPGDALCHYYLGVTETARGDLEKAEQEYKLAIGYNAELGEAYNNLGLLLLDKGQLALAEAQIHNYLRLSPKSSDAHYNYGLVLTALGRGQEAQTFFAKAFELSPEDPAPQLRLGDLARMGGQEQKAIEHYRMALSVDAHSTDAILLIAQTQLAIDETDNAQTTLEQLHSLDQTTAADFATAGILLAGIGKDQRALVFYQKAIETDVDYAPAHLLAANALARGEQFAQAAKHYEYFLTLDPGPREEKVARERLDICRQKVKR